ncbi:assimilatory sulfite reductase (NADPH) flavoprotein subunit [Mesorhizobium sp. A556]
MTALEFPGPGFSAEQWERLNGLATTLKPGQALWISGYFAGIDHARALHGETAIPLRLSEPAVSAPVAVASRTLTILYAGETGNSAGVAKALAEAFRAQGGSPTVVDVVDYKPRKLKDEQDLLVVTSTHGEGDAPLSAVGFFEFVEGRKAPRLEGVRFAVLALGDSTYEHYCGAGKRLDARLEELGAERLAERIDCDVDYDEPAAAWTKTALELLAPKTIQASVPAQAVGSAAPSITPSAFNKKNPFAATVIDNLVLTGSGSSKETRHIELSLAGSGLTYEPGDALGMMPRNDPALVEALLDALSLAADAPLSIKERATTLGEALVDTLEITAATPRFLDHWAGLSEAGELQALRGAENAEAHRTFLRDHHIIDVVRRYPVAGIEPQAFAAGLRPLQPRLYSIASSLSTAPDEAHLTVSTVRYDLHGEPREGVASGHFAKRAAPDAAIPVYIQANSHFRLPDDDKPIIMIGAGTGVAPYRAFLQEREARGASGKSWLFFGERNFDSDFLYQTEWQELLKDGVLSRMSVAFSRDATTKTYIQHRLAEQARDVYAWLEEGAHVYVCGDGARLAPDVHSALAAIVEQQGARSSAAAGDYLATLKNDHRYQIDVY